MAAARRRAAESAAPRPLLVGTPPADAPPAEQAVPTGALAHVHMIPSAQIRPGRYQKRLAEARDEETYQHLLAQMRADYERGHLKLLLFVMPDPQNPGFYHPSRGGHRRLEIAQILGVPEILCYVDEYDPGDLAAGTYFENEGRQDLSIIEKGLMYQAFMDDYGLTQEEVATHYCVKGGQPYVGRCVRAARYQPDIQSLILADPERALRVADILAQLDAVEDGVTKRAPLIAAFKARTLTTDQVSQAVKAILQGQPVVLDEQGVHSLARQDRIMALEKGFDRWSRTLGTAAPSEEERLRLAQVRTLIDAILAR